MSSSSNNAHFFNDVDECEDRDAEQNHKFDRIIEDVVSLTATMAVQPTNHIVRAKRRYIERKREDGHENLFEQYFSDNLIYPPEVFRRRFRMQKSLFERIMNKVVANDEFFRQRRDAAGRLGIISNFGAEYLRKPTAQDLAYLLQVKEQRGFTGMMGSIDCKHWEWKNCPSAWAGQYAGRSGKPTIILEAVASQDLWIWHAFFGTPGSRNDINVLDQSPIFNDILEGRALNINYTINGHNYNNMGYYLTDGIYPRWAAFVKSINAPQIRKHKLFAQHQKAAHKDVERAFGVLQARFTFIKQPCLIWDREIIGKIMCACIIMHNMIVEDERHNYLNYHDPTEFFEAQPTPNGRQDRVGEENEDSNFEVSTERIASLSAI